MKKAVSIFVVVSLILSIVLPIGYANGDTKGKSALETLKESGVVTGYEDGSLHGDDPVSRSQFALMICNAFSVGNAEGKSAFSDVANDHWAYQSVQKCANAGWLSGYGDGTFGADDNITYEQALSVVCRICGLSGYYDNYPSSYVANAIDAGLCDGVDALIGDVITREQVAKIIVNAMEYIAANNINTEGNTYTLSKTAPQALSKGYALAGGGGGGGGVGGSASYGAYYTADMAMGYYPTTAPGYNTEEYSSKEENVFKDALTSPLSTFSIDTDTASYSNMRRFIINGQKISTGSIRTEELINYFDYEGPEVKPGDVFGVKTEVGVCPWNTENKLAMITVKGEEYTDYMPSNLVFLIDTSGSMYSYNKLEYVKKALSMLLDKLGENDTVSIVTYASGTRVALSPTSAAEKEKILKVIGSLQAGGATAGASGISLAYDQAEKAKIDGNNRIILCTDGDFNVGISSTADLEKLIEEKRKTGIYLSVLGFGMGNLKDNRMEILADKGNGNYAYIDTLREAKKVLVDDMSKTIYAIAKDVKIQVEFNPSQVKSYRLVGYENRVLNNEDFANDQKDAGELGAGSTVTVFYEIVPAEGTEKTDLKYQEITPKASTELMTVKIRYKPLHSDESILKEFPVAGSTEENLSDDFRFAAAVAELGMILNESEYKGSSTFDTVIELASSSTSRDKFGFRREFVQLVDLLKYNSR